MWLDEERTALYRFYDASGALLYVGITANIEERWKDHSQQKPWWGQVDRREVGWFDSRPQALAAELRAIHEENPVHNVQGKPWSFTQRRLKESEYTATQVRSRLGGLCQQVRHSGSPIVVVGPTRDRKPAAVIIGFDRYEQAKADRAKLEELKKSHPDLFE